MRNNLSRLFMYTHGGDPPERRTAMPVVIFHPIHTEVQNNWLLLH